MIKSRSFATKTGDAGRGHLPQALRGGHRQWGCSHCWQLWHRQPWLSGCFTCFWVLDSHVGDVLQGRFSAAPLLPYQGFYWLCAEVGHVEQSSHHTPRCGPTIGEIFSRTTVLKPAAHWNQEELLKLESLGFQCPPSTF